MASVITSNRDGLIAVYDDRLMPLFEALGHVTIRRASEVEYDHARKQWVAVEVDKGREIASGSNRADVIAAEVQWLESNVIAPKRTERSV